MTATLVSPEPTTLEQLADAISAEHQALQASLKTTLFHALRCGQLLIEAKRKLSHGGFMRWVEKHCAVSYSTANRYMLLARELPKVPTVGTLPDLSQRGAAKRLPEISLDEAELLIWKTSNQRKAEEAERRLTPEERAEAAGSAAKYAAFEERFDTEPGPISARWAIEQIRVLLKHVKEEYRADLKVTKRFPQKCGDRRKLSPEGARFLAKLIHELGTEYLTIAKELADANPPIGETQYQTCAFCRQPVAIIKGQFHWRRSRNGRNESYAHNACAKAGAAVPPIVAGRDLNARSADAPVERSHVSTHAGRVSNPRSAEPAASDRTLERSATR
jgi:hypothetical protein